MTSISKHFVNALKERSNKRFLRSLYRLPVGSSKNERKKLLSKASEAQLKFLIYLLHYIFSGELSLRACDLSKIRNREALSATFKSKEDAKRLANAHSLEQRQELGQVTNFRYLLHCLMCNHCARMLSGCKAEA